MANFKSWNRGSDLNSGFQITFENGLTVSVVWGIGTYGGQTGQLAEVAVIDADGHINDPVGYRSPANVAAIIHEVSQR